MQDREHRRTTDAGEVSVKYQLRSLFADPSKNLFRAILDIRFVRNQAFEKVGNRFRMSWHLSGDSFPVPTFLPRDSKISVEFIAPPL